MTSQNVLPTSAADRLRYVRMLESGKFNEELLETALIEVPHLIHPAPRFYGRQIPVDSGRLDLFGLSGEHRFPTVYELKAGKIQRGDIAQVLDYALAISEMSAEDLAWHLMRHSGGAGTGIGRIWHPRALQETIENVWYLPTGNFTWRVIVGTDYDDNVARLAKHTEVELYTVSELCCGYRERRSRHPKFRDSGGN